MLFPASQETRTESEKNMNDTTNPEPAEFTGRATYSPEDNKLRLYIGRVPRDEYLKLKSDGWATLHKQREAGGGDFVATWTPSRRDTALAYAGIIEDEDMGPDERAADRAERFGGYRDKRLGEAIGHADKYDAGPVVHGFQSQARAEKAAARHDRIADRAGDAWSKADYWVRRTEGVIAHALYRSDPGVRMGRIKELEADLRKTDAEIAEYTRKFKYWTKVAAIEDPEKQTEAARMVAGRFNFWSEYVNPHTGQKESLWKLLDPKPTYGTEVPHPTVTGKQAAEFYFSDHMDPESPKFQETRWMDWKRHYELRIAYENQMIEAAGGRAAHVEMVPGGFINGKQIQKVNRSSVTGRVVSVAVWGTHTGYSKASGYTRSETMKCLVSIATERLPADAYRAPTDEELAAFEAEKKAAKAATPKKPACPLINPTDEDAAKLQGIWNAAEHSRFAKPQEPVKMTFEQYDGRGKTVTVCEEGTEHRTHYGSNITRSDVFKVRSVYGDGYSARRVVILTDKPQKDIPWEAIASARASHPTAESMRPRLEELQALVEALKGWAPRTREQQQLLSDAAYIGWMEIDGQSPRWTEAGAVEVKRLQSAAITA